MIVSPATHAISINPATGEQLSAQRWATHEEIDAALNVAEIGYRLWRRRSLSERAATLRTLGALLHHHCEALAKMISLEMGKPIGQAHSEVIKSAELCDWYAGYGPGMLATQPTQVGPEAVMEYRPVGAILAVMPWNFPVWQVLRGAVPILLAGNSYLLKHAPNVMGCAGLLNDLMQQAGFPAGAFSLVNAAADGVTQMINDPRIAAVTVIGSVRAGRAIGAQAGFALKKCVLELGGSDPFIVLADASLDAAVAAAITGRYQNTGQGCAAAKRFIVDESVCEAFTGRFIAAVQALKMGNPLDESNYIGPMARFDLRDKLHQQVLDSLEEGAHLALGGEAVSGAGNYYLPTVLTGVTPKMRAFREELFGPVAAITVARDAAHALELANDSEFGLSATIYSANEIAALEMAERLECGGVFINGYCASDPRVAFGGVKHSGFGRELAQYGLHEFCNVQTLWRNRR